jgi:hypothetical protein
LAQVFARFGARVTLLETLPRILVKEVRDAPALVELALRRDAIEILSGMNRIGVGQRSEERLLQLIGPPALVETIHPYPTQSEAIKKVADAYYRIRLTRFVKGLFKKLMGWRQYAKRITQLRSGSRTSLSSSAQPQVKTDGRA